MWKWNILTVIIWLFSCKYLNNCRLRVGLIRIWFHLLVHILGPNFLDLKPVYKWVRSLVFYLRKCKFKNNHFYTKLQYFLLKIVIVLKIISFFKSFTFKVNNNKAIKSGLSQNSQFVSFNSVFHHFIFGFPQSQGFRL